MSAVLPSRRVLALLSAAVFGAVFVLFVLGERSGLGLGHYYYIAIALAALAGGTRAGIGAGALAAALFQIGVVVNPHLETSTTLTLGTPIRASTFIAIGALVGWFAQRHRLLVSELQVLADRDELTGLPNARGFEAAIGRRLETGLPFVLLIGKLAGAAEGESADDALRLVAGRLLLLLDPSDEIARIGELEFAVLAGSDAKPSSLAAKLEAASASSFGWSSCPDDGENALALYRAASERLYARSLVRDLNARQQAGV